MLQDRVALVTGSSGGIGKAIALALAAQGARVVVHGRNPQRTAEVLAQVQLLSPDSESSVGDVTDTPAMQSLIDQILGRHGRLDILVNNAGITRDTLLMRMKREQWDEVLANNLTSVFTLAQLAVKPMMKARWGRIINITSVVGVSGNAGQTNYAAAKAGVAGFSKSLAREVASRGITVNCIAPGFIETAMTDSLKPEARDAILSQIPVGTMGQPEDVAAAAVFLASPAARYITGETLHVNGGMAMV
ncbi:MAG: 3-oxoacyl-ACP reductase FabG [Magnetococcus sp. WYHC-3]